MPGQGAAGTRTFADLGVSKVVVAQLAEGGFVDAFPIQTATIEATLAGRDICGKAPTGSGKTLAFGVPVIDLVEYGKPKRPRALILAPTRELATQIREELAPLAKVRSLTMFTVFGGTGIDRDRKRLAQGVDILVACPGRLEDLIDTGHCRLDDVDLVVVDEADRMSDMGFLPGVKRILDQTSPDRHTLLFSATLDGDVDTLIRRYQTDPMTFEVDEQVGDVGEVDHFWYQVHGKGKTDIAAQILQTHDSAIVFCRTRKGCDRLAKMFRARDINAVAIHGDLSQAQRERALREFTSGKAQTLVATDVAARGIHVDNVDLVMHFDPAGTDKDYVHRSGRTGRAGADGHVISLVVKEKAGLARGLQKALGMPIGFDELDTENLPKVRSTPGREDDSRRSKRGAPERPRREGGQSRGGDRRPKRDRPKRDGDDRSKRDRPKRDRPKRDGDSDRDRPGRPARSGPGKPGSFKARTDHSGTRTSGSGKPGSSKSGSSKPGSRKPGSGQSRYERDGDDRPYRSGSGKSASGKPRSGKSGSGKSGSGKSGSGRSRYEHEEDDPKQGWRTGRPPEDHPASGKPKSGKPISGKASSGKAGSGKSSTGKSGSGKSGSGKPGGKKSDAASARRRPKKRWANEEKEQEARKGKGKRRGPKGKR